jgi:hypothetical protein
MQHDTIKVKIDVTIFAMAQIYAIENFLSKANV